MWSHSCLWPQREERLLWPAAFHCVLESDHCLQCQSQPQPQLLSRTIMTSREVGSSIFWWSKQEHLFSVPLGKPELIIMLILAWLYSEVPGGFEKLALMMTLSLHIVVLHSISGALGKSWQCPTCSTDDSEDVSRDGDIVSLLLKRPDIFYFPQQLPGILNSGCLHKI